MMSVYWLTWYSTLNTFCWAEVLMFLALFAYLSVLCVSSKCLIEGPIFAIIIV